MKKWYLVFTKPKKETVAEENLARQGFDVYLPRLLTSKRQRGRWLSSTEPMFPRYLFIRLALGRDDIQPIRSTIGVSSLVRFSLEPAIVPDHIVESLRSNADLETGWCHRTMTPFRPGDGVVIDKGPLSGLTAIYLADSGRERVSILLSMLGKQNIVKIDANALRPMSA